MAQPNNDNHFKKAQETFQQFTQLNTEALKDFQASLKPVEFGKAARPEEIWTQQIEWTLAHAQKGVDYLQKSLQIIRSIVSDAKEDAKKQ